MKIKYFSDLHLEFLNNLNSNWIKSIIKLDADILILAGDIGYPSSKSYKNLLLEINAMFERVYLITGNHEYYSNKSIEENNQIIRDIIKNNNLSNIKLLLNDFDDYKGYRFIGSTLWSKIVNPLYLITDFDYIKDISIEKYNNLHKESVYFIEKTLSQTKLPVIMITHHLPSYTLNDPKYETYSHYNQCFSSEIDYLIAKPVVVWFYGHTHTPSLKEINGVKMCCNPIGYPDEQTKPDFNCIIEL
jgi:predicted MPP superfamily phosphohydrolase